MKISKPACLILVSNSGRFQIYLQHIGPPHKPANLEDFFVRLTIAIGLPFLE
ncbi:MAG: hypothetical protein ABSB11_04680 [Sedimentisphaerales bacterium]